MNAEVKVGNKYQIHCYKHDGTLYQTSEEAIVLDVTDEYIVCANKMVEVTELEDSYKTKELAIIYFYKHNWFNCIAQLKDFGLYYYCNIASPYVIDEDIIKYIDYDLDLRVFPDGGYRILDKREYKYHKKKMKYPEEIDIITKNELTKLIDMKRKKEGPFNKEELEKYRDKYYELQNKS